jgi:N-acetylmuramoyl-L-alanine amidase
MGRALAALAVLLVAVPTQGARATHRAQAARLRPAARARRGVRPPTLAQAKAAMTALMRDRARRRFHHHWERGIGALLDAARGKDAAAAYLEAARARYALYRWSADEADREKALLNAARAAARGSRDARVLAAAIRREAGDDRPARAARTSIPPRHEPAEQEESPPDPALEAALADLATGSAPALPLGASENGGPARVSHVRAWSSEDYTRVAIYLSQWAGWQKIELPAEADRPRRLAFDLRPARLAGAALARAVPGDRVDRVRAAQHDPETVRVVLDLPGADGVQVFALEDPPRLVVDVGARAPRRGPGAPDGAQARIEPAPLDEAVPPVPDDGAQGRDGSPDEVARAASDEAPDGGAQARAEAPNEVAPARSHEGPDEAADEAAQSADGPVRRVVVDAGHGGHDPGAIGPRRVREKDVTLAIARRLARRLRSAGFEVVLTRSDDRYLALEERTAIANTARADLFVSIHANAHPARNRNGVETYFLNVADDRYAARLAARENGLDLDGEREVGRILTDLGAKASAGASRELARLVQRQMCSSIRAHVGDVRDLGVKGALFYVLLGARMPAVLVETAFVSNRTEERRLASARYQDQVAAAIARAVSEFASPQRRLATAGD